MARAGGLRHLGHADAAIEPGPEQRRGERVHVRLARDARRPAVQPAGGGQQQRDRVGASARDERQLRSQQVDPRSLQLVERPGLGHGQHPASRAELAGQQVRLSGRQRASPTSRQVGRQRDSALQEGRRGGDASASLRATRRALELGGDVFVGSRCRQRAVPRAPIGVGLRIAHLSQRFVHPLPVVG